MQPSPMNYVEDTWSSGKTLVSHDSIPALNRAVYGAGRSMDRPGTVRPHSPAYTGLLVCSRQGPMLMRETRVRLTEYLI